ncbi:hypothetical protein O7632_25245 [Solwaraspora sp. WMMD406]|uniref:hypothetical protein n=1 Tax=Solwaraspora sp. WMMD406 TaxID=3016095 RepID=UPI002415A43B|nr:hypothetical protein [Solwaraspora sp. WMMD406]MDG4767371.1 hypothetical protein [Solwaraspora sp. WMMD406]
MTAAEVPASAERGVSAPPEVAFGTATDPDRRTAWMPAPLHQARREQVSADRLQARWRATGTSWAATVQVYAVQAGGAMMRLELDADLPHEELTRIADEALTGLVDAVTDNLNAG